MSLFQAAFQNLSIKGKKVLFKKDPRKKLAKAYQQKMEEAMKAMRNGDVRGNAFLVKEAEEIKAQLDQLA